LAVCRPAKNVGLPPFVSIMPYFGPHDGAFFGESSLRSRWFSKASNPRGEGMAYVKRKANKIPPAARGFSLSGTIALVAGAFAMASGAAVWTEGFDPVTRVSGAASPKDINPTDINTPSFDDRFSVGSAPGLPSTGSPPRSVVRSLPSELELKFQQAKDRLAERLQPQGWRVALIEEPKPSSVPAVPLPRPRPVEEPKNDASNARAEVPVARAENRTLLEKLSDLVPGRVTLASLVPDGGLFGKRPDLASLGYDNVTAVYDISARTVYMPDGSKLEAHSGYGSLMDDPAHVNAPNVGATPPNVYDLRPRETLFHGVQALRMIPVGDNDTLGRSGLLAHNYMLGPNGDSNGCVSIKNYEKFLKAFTNGEIKRLVVVPRLEERRIGDEKPALRQST
jgi:hypothetical protein